MPLDGTALQLGNILAVRARLHYALGNLEAAASDISEALQYFRHAQNQSAIRQAEKESAFYQALLADRQGE